MTAIHQFCMFTNSKTDRYSPLFHAVASHFIFHMAESTG